MKIAKPQVHLRFDNTGEVHMIHVITWMDHTKFREDGYDMLPSSAVDGVFSITLKIKEDNSVPNMDLLTPIVHTIELTAIELNSTDPFIEINVVNTSDSNSLIGRTKTHQDDSDESGMPGPKPLK